MPLLHKKLVFFDFDGVFVDTKDLSYTLRKMSGPSLDKERYPGYFKGNIWNVRQEKIPTEEDFAEQGNPYKQEIANMAPHDGLRDVVANLASLYTLAIVSSTPTEFIRDYLRVHEIDRCFFEIFGSEVETSTSIKIKMLLAATGLKCTDAVLVTDTLGDIIEARAVDVPSIAVTWGYHSTTTLQEGIPIALVDHAEDLEAVVHRFLS